MISPKRILFPTEYHSNGKVLILDPLMASQAKKQYFVNTIISLPSLQWCGVSDTNEWKILNLVTKENMATFQKSIAGTVTKDFITLFKSICNIDDGLYSKSNTIILSKLKDIICTFYPRSSISGENISGSGINNNAISQGVINTYSDSTPGLMDAIAQMLQEDTKRWMDAYSDREYGQITEDKLKSFENSKDGATLLSRLKPSSFIYNRYYDKALQDSMPTPFPKKCSYTELIDTIDILKEMCNEGASVAELLSMVEFSKFTLVFSSTSKFCRIKNGYHANNHVYYTVNILAKTFCQKCFDVDCARLTEKRLEEYTQKHPLTNFGKTYKEKSEDYLDIKSPKGKSENYSFPFDKDLNSIIHNYLNLSKETVLRDSGIIINNNT